jgi:hypothetical protein
MGHVDSNQVLLSSYASNGFNSCSTTHTQGVATRSIPASSAARKRYCGDDSLKSASVFMLTTRNGPTTV